MTFTLRRLALCALVCVAVIFAGLVPARASGEFGGSGKFVGWWELGGYYGTDDSSRGEVVLFTPLMQSASTLFFLDARGKLFEEDVQEANIALGYRQMMASGWNLGLWAGWDIRDSEADNTFHQVSFGLEALSERYDLRVNGYVPITDPKGSPGLAEVFLRGNNILMIGGEEVPLYGVDGEIGVLFFGGNRGGGGLKGALAKRHELRAYAGGFWFDADDANEEVAGPKGRLEYRINDVITSLPGSRLTIESELSYDEVRDTKFEIGARLRIPFGARGSDAASRMAALTGQELRMIEGLERDTDIVTTQSEEENVFDTLTGVHFDRARLIQGNDALLDNTLAAVGPNSLVVVDGGTSGQTEVGSNQTLQGGGSTILVTGRRTGTTAGFTGPGSRPLILNTDPSAVVTLNGNNIHLAGLAIQGAGSGSTFLLGNRGISGGSSRSNIVIEQSRFANLGDDIIRFDNDNSNIRIMTSSFMDSGTDAVEFVERNTDIYIADLLIGNVRFDGIDFNENNSNIRVENVVVNDTGATGLFFNDTNSNIRIKNVVVNNAGVDGIEFFDNGNTDIRVENVVINNANNAAIDVGPGNSNFWFRNVVINIPGEDGFDFNNNNSNIRIENVEINNPGDNGFSFNDGNSDIRIVNAEINNPVSDGFDFALNNTGVVITDTTVNGAGVDGMNMGGGNEIEMSNTTFTGLFVDDAIDISAAGNTLGGAGNVFTGTVGDQFCSVTGAQTGQFVFPGGPSNCPP